MAIDYAKVLKHLNLDIAVIGRSEQSARRFEAETGITPYIGGLDSYLKENGPLNGLIAIVATSVDSLMHNVKALIDSRVAKILVEKPAAVSIDELVENREYLIKADTKVYVAYNRRFYASVQEVKKIIEEDGGLLSMSFEFTEWAHRIEAIDKPQIIKNNWFFANSTHVVDLAFYLAGKPERWSTYAQTGSITWHPVSNFSGAGVTNRNVVFSYLSNWESAGRWGVELLTTKRRIILRPLEEVKYVLRGELNEHILQFERSDDTSFKPGLLRQVLAFVENSSDRLCTMEEHLENTRLIYSKIVGVNTR